MSHPHANERDSPIRWQALVFLAKTRGFTTVRELREGCLVPAIGAGLCQLSGLLYQAVLNTALEIVKRHAHSRVIPGSSAEQNLDATVFWWLRGSALPRETRLADRDRAHRLRPPEHDLLYEFTTPYPAALNAADLCLAGSMRRILTIALLALSLCPWQPASAQVPFGAETCPEPLPGLERAKAAAARVRPGLETDLTARGLYIGDPVFFRAFKEEKQLEVWVRKRGTGIYELFRTWPIAAMSGKPGPKLAEGDGQVPEGFYYVTPVLMKPDSTFHLGFNIGYPNAYDRHHGRTGSCIMIHGNRVSIGCLAMTDEKIEEIYTLCDAALTNGQKLVRVHVFPFRMGAGRMAKETANEWFDFWKQLQEGYGFF